MTTSTKTVRLARILTAVLAAGTIAVMTAAQAAATVTESASVADLILSQERTRIAESTAETRSVADLILAQEQARPSKPTSETPSVADLIAAQEQARLGTRDGTSALPAQTSAPQGFDWRDAWIGIGAVLLLSALLAAGVKAGGRRSRTAGA